MTLGRRSAWNTFAVCVAMWLPCQAMAGDHPKVLTVCEILADPGRYNGTAVAVVGRLAPVISLIDSSEFLSQDRCDQPIVTQERPWPNQILIWSSLEEGMPKPPGDEPKLDLPVLGEKLATVRKNTNLGTHQVPRLNGGVVLVPNEWAVVYGRVFSSAHLTRRGPCHGIGCNGFMGAPLAIIIERKNLHSFNDDGSLRR